MKRLRRILRYFLAALLVLAALGGLAVWWIFYRSLPQLDGTASLPELQQEVTVDRDAWGVPHIRANSLQDLLAAQGYVVAQDRLWQMDLLRRAAAGELSEIFGPLTLDLDRENRVLGMRAAAERTAAALDPETRAILEAYARGVNRYIEERRGRLPWEFVALRYQPRPWTPTDSLLIGAQMYKTLTSTWRWELSRAKAIERVGPERARELFVVESSLDHFIVGAEAPSKPQPRLVVGGEAPAKAQPRQPRAKAAPLPASRPSARAQPAPPLQVSAGLEELVGPSAQRLLAQFESEAEAFLGSNNWVVSGAHTYSGKPILANDTHLPLDVPCIWYMAHLTAPGWNVKGFTFPGAPLVVIGHNARIAWGFTNNGADVQDLFIETFNSANPREYRVNGQWVAAEIRRETIRVRGRPDEVLEVTVTRHGPIVHREEGRAYALKWTATEKGGLAFALPMLGRAQNWQEFREVMRRVTGPAQNAVYADVEGNIGFLVAARIPTRKKGNGAVPVPGDADDHEWTGYIPFDELPQTLNPPGGVIATANARVAGPGYRWHLTDRWAGPHRTARIYELLIKKKPLRPPDCIAIQTDVVSLPHRFLAEQLVRAGQQGQPSDPRTRALLSKLTGWEGRAGADSVELALVESMRRAVMRNLLRPFFGDQTNQYEWWRHIVFLENVLRHRPAHWLPKEFRSYDELLLASADEAVRQLEAESGRREATQWRWGRFVELQMLHPLGRSGWLARLLSVGPVEQGGTGHTVKQTGRRIGPAQRFVADLSNLDNSLMNLTVGQSGQLLSPHYRDQFPAWFEGRGLPSAFSEAAQEKARVHRLRLTPQW